jgi:hypothetical protein
MEIHMTKTRLNNTHRELLTTYGHEKIASLIDRGEEKAFYAQLLGGANQAIRKRYPEEDMVILRRYDATHIDRCVRFQFPSGRVDGFFFPREETALADIPYCRSCTSDAAYAVDAAIETAFDGYHKTHTANNKEQHNRLAVFDALIRAARTLEEVMEAIDVPTELLERLGRKTTALVALSSDSLKQLKQDFALTKPDSKERNESEQADAKARKEAV